MQTDPVPGYLKPATLRNDDGALAHGASFIFMQEPFGFFRPSPPFKYDDKDTNGR